MVRESIEFPGRAATDFCDVGDGERPKAARKVHSRCLRTSLIVLWALLVFGALLSMDVATAQVKNSCVECHSQMEGPLLEPVQLVKNDVHGSHGLSCVDCHRGDASADDMLAAMSPSKGFIGKPKAKDIPMFCGTCHSNADRMKTFAPALRVDQEREYATSVHGKRLHEGDQRVATCISCHGMHGVRAVADPLSPVYALNVAETCSKCHADADLMKDYKIPTDQYGRYRTSVHAAALYGRQDLSAPTCNDCHGNHGAAPPGLTSVANVCGQCHVRQSTLFAGSPHKAAFDAMQLSECVECHSNHGIASPGDEMIGVGQESVCIKCHTEGDPGYLGAQKMRGGIDELAAGIVKAEEILSQAERAGMEVSRPKFELNEAKDSLTHSRVLIHAFSSGEVDKVVEPGLAAAIKGHTAGEAALTEWRFRRKGLAASLFFILFLAVLVYFKIRQIEGRKSTDSA